MKSIKEEIDKSSRWMIDMDSMVKTDRGYLKFSDIGSENPEWVCRTFNLTDNGEQVESTEIE